MSSSKSLNSLKTACRRRDRNLRVRFREFRALLLAGGNVDEAIAHYRWRCGAAGGKTVDEMNDAKRRGENV